MSGRRNSKSALDAPPKGGLWIMAQRFRHAERALVVRTHNGIDLVTEMWRATEYASRSTVTRAMKTMGLDGVTWRNRRFVVVDALEAFMVGEVSFVPDNKIAVWRVRETDGSVTRRLTWIDEPLPPIDHGAVVVGRAVWATVNVKMRTTAGPHAWIFFPDPETLRQRRAYVVDMLDAGELTLVEDVDFNDDDVI